MAHARARPTAAGGSEDSSAAPRLAHAPLGVGSGRCPPTPSWLWAPTVFLPSSSEAGTQKPDFHEPEAQGPSGVGGSPSSPTLGSSSLSGLHRRPQGPAQLGFQQPRWEGRALTARLCRPPPATWPACRLNLLQETTVASSCVQLCTAWGGGVDGVEGAAAGGPHWRGQSWAWPPGQSRKGRGSSPGWPGLASSQAPAGWTPAGTHTPTCHTFLLGSAFSHARSWHSRPCHAGTCHPDPRKVGEAFLGAWRQGPLQVKTRPGVGDAGLQHRLSSCRRPSPRLARVPARLPTLAPTPRRGGRRAWVGRGRQVPTLL